MNGIAPYPYFCRASETLVALGVMGTTFAELGGATRLVLIRWSLIFQVVEWFVFNIQSHASQEYRSWSVPSSMPDAKGMRAWPSRPRTNQFPATKVDCLSSSSAGTRVFAPAHDDPRHKNRSAVWGVARGL